jgi:hypothetical protein
MGQITINKEPSFQEVWREGFVENDGKFFTIFIDKIN